MSASRRALFEIDTHQFLADELRRDSQRTADPPPEPVPSSVREHGLVDRVRSLMTGRKVSILPVDSSPSGTSSAVSQGSPMETSS